MTTLENPVGRPNRHANCIPQVESAKEGKKADEIEVSDLRCHTDRVAMKTRKIYNVTQLPPPVPEMSSFETQEREEKRRHVENEEKIVAKKMERRIKDISHIYRISVPAISESNISRSHSGQDRLPDIYQGGRMSETSYRQNKRPLAFPYRGSLFRATMEDRKRNSRSYEEFVGRLSYLINQSRAKMSVLYGNTDPHVIKQFLGKKSRDNFGGRGQRSESDDMRAFRQKQFSIGHAVRKVLDREEIMSLHK